MNKKEALQQGYLTSYNLAKATGLERLVVTRSANKIPGAIKLEDTGRWVFPQSAVIWIVNRIKLNLRT